MRLIRSSIMTISAMAIFIGSCGPLTFTVGGARDQRLRATVVQPDGQSGSYRVAIVDVSGLIINANKHRLLQSGENPVSLLQEKLVASARDQRVKAVILRLNTPGGAVTATDAMYRQLLRFRQETGKPVVALLMDVATSGGFYVACAADRIVAYPTTVTGSVGVIIQIISVKPGLSRIGVLTESLTSGPNKNAGSPFSVLTEEHRAVLQKLVDDFHRRFVQVVQESRPDISPDEFATVIDGRVFSGEDAVAIGLVDTVGDLYVALDEAKRLAGIRDADLVIYHRPLDYVGSPYAWSPGPLRAEGTEVNLVQLNLNGLSALEASPGFYYLWRPELP